MTYYFLALLVLFIMSIALRKTAAFTAKGLGAHMALNRMFSASAGATGLPEGDEAKAFYTLGVNVARKLVDTKKQLKSEELTHLAQGFTDAMTDRVSEEQESELYEKYGPVLSKILDSRIGAASASEKQKGAAFIDEYMQANPSAKKTASGLVYEEKRAGSGGQPVASSTVKVHYHGTLTNGQVFDSSVDRGEPISFPLSGVIKGWTEGVALMKVGGKSRLICPPDLAYGDRGSPPVIPAGATLIFDVELIDIEK